MSNWPHTSNELGEFIAVILLCFLPAIVIIMAINGFINGVLY